MRVARARAATSAALALAMMLALVLVGPSRARAAQQPLPLRLSVASMTPITGPGAGPDGGVDTFQMQVTVLNDAPLGEPHAQNVEVVVETYGRVSSRGVLRLILDEGIVSGARTVQRLPVGDGSLAPSDAATVAFELTAGRLSQAGASGVYPVKVSVTRGTTVLDSVVTAVVHLAETPANPLAAVAVWPIDAPPYSPLRIADGALSADLAPGGRLHALIHALADVGDGGLVPAVGPHVVEALLRLANPPEPLEADDQAPDEAADVAEEAAEGSVPPAEPALDATPTPPTSPEAAQRLLDLLRGAVVEGNNPPLAAALVDADLAALLDGAPALAEQAGNLASEGARRVEGLLGRAADPSAWLATGPTTTRTLDLVPGDHVLLRWDQTVGPDLDLDPSLPPVVRPIRTDAGRLLSASVADPYLAQHLATMDETHGSAVAVQRILAGTALAHFELPGVADRPFVLMPPDAWSPSSAAAQRLAEAINRAPWLNLVSAGSHGRLAETGQADLELASVVPTLSAADASRIARSTRGLDDLRRSLPQGTRLVNGRPPLDLEEDLLRATSTWWADDPASREELLAGVEATIDNAYGAVEVRAGETITLLSEQGMIPITLRRTAGPPIVVDVEVLSSGRLSWPQGTTQRVTLLDSTIQTLTFETTARSRGDIPVTVEVRDVGGTRVLTNATFKVRSTIVSRPALILTGSVVVALLLLGRWRRRPRSAEPDGGPDGEPSSTGDGPDGPSAPTATSAIDADLVVARGRRGRRDRK